MFSANAISSNVSVLGGTFIFRLCAVFLVCFSLFSCKGIATGGSMDASEEINNGTNPVICISTSKGNLFVELFEDKAPNTVAHIIELTEKGFYKNMLFDRLVSNVSISGGSANARVGLEGKPVGDGTPGYFVKYEATGLSHNQAGIMGMERMEDDADSVGSQFYLTFRAARRLDHSYTIVGRVINGFDVLRTLQQAKVSLTNKPVSPIHFEIRVVSKRNHKYVAKKIPLGSRK